MIKPTTAEQATHIQSNADALWYDYESEEPITSSRRGIWLVLASLGYAFIVLVAAF